MLRPFASLFSRKKSKTMTFKDYYTEWFNTLQKTLLPLIQKSLSSSSSQTLLCTHVDLLLRHFLSYYDALDLAANRESFPQLLFPSWRNSLEIPFLFLGDLHPYLFTNLVRSFLDEGSEDEEEGDEGRGEEDEDEEEGDDSFDNRPWQVFMAWRNVSKNLMTQIEQIECGLRLMVPALMGRMKKVQGSFVGRIAENWVALEGQSDDDVLKGVIGEAMKEEMGDMVSVFVDANRLRKSVITEIVGALSVYQAALFLEGLAQFLVGLRDREVLGEFNRCKIWIS